MSRTISTIWSCISGSPPVMETESKRRREVKRSMSARTCWSDLSQRGSLRE
ncbi:MAG: hypothetical protein QM765_25060 [Myxococcales bacterium]